MNEQNSKFIRRPESREDWLAVRNTGIGGSDVAAILGLSPWRTAVQVWEEKTGRLPQAPETLAMRLGTELEDFVARRYAAETGLGVRNYGYVIRRGHLVGNIDRLVATDPGKNPAHHEEIRTDLILECKTASRPWGRDENGGPVVPDHYLAQVQTYMHLSGCSRCDVAVLFLAPAKDYRIVHVERDERIGEAIEAAVEDWWARYVEADVRPPIVDPSDAVAIFPASAAGTSATAGEDVVAALATIGAAQSIIDEQEAIKDAAKARVMEAMGEAETLFGPDGRRLATWKTVSTRRLDTKAAKAALGDALEPFYKTTEARAFRVL